MGPTPIEEARAFVRDYVQEAAIKSALPVAIKNKVRNADRWLSQFKRVGDLLNYLRRFKPDNDDIVYRELKKHGLLTFEDILPEFEKRFAPWANDCTRRSDFVVGEAYSAFDILIFSNTYDTRAGGMFVIEAAGKPVSVVIKATLQNGRYPNQWLEPQKKLKYYLKSIDGVFGEHFKPNAAILNHPNIPIVTFVRTDTEASFVYSGIFRFKDIVREPDGKYFELVLSEAQPPDLVAAAEHIQSKLAQEVAVATKCDRTLRLERLAKSPKKARKISVVAQAFDRNPDVIAEVLHRAQGKCEHCSLPAPFKRKTDGTPYLEVHHRIPLADDGDDTVENAVALCPNCHRKQHFG